LELEVLGWVPELAMAPQEMRLLVPGLVRALVQQMRVHLFQRLLRPLVLRPALAGLCRRLISLRRL
jgi:hypothetical protein